MGFCLSFFWGGGEGEKRDRMNKTPQHTQKKPTKNLCVRIVTYAPE